MHGALREQRIDCQLVLPKSCYSFCRSNKDDKNQEPLKVDTSSHDILEVDQPSASSGIGPSPKNDSESPKVKRYF